MKEFLEKIKSGATLSETEMTAAMTLIMDGKAQEDEVEQFLIALAARGETVDELVGAARVIRARAAVIDAPEDALDCCGTGGDRAGTYNISTAVAFVAASCGVPVAKHGNRASSSKSGAADALEALGVNIDLPKDRLEHALHTWNFAFLLATRHHEAMKNVAAIRKKIPGRTIFNLLGPLANPAGTKLQLLGVFSAQWLIPLAQAAERLGSRRVWVVCGEDGLDEITTTGATRAAMLDNGAITERIFTPEDFGLAVSSPDDLTGGDAQENAAAMLRLLEGEKSAYRDIVLANAAAAISLHNPQIALSSAMAQATQALDSGAAKHVFESYRRYSQEGERA